MKLLTGRPEVKLLKAPMNIDEWAEWYQQRIIELMMVPKELLYPQGDQNAKETYTGRGQVWRRPS